MSSKCTAAKAYDILGIYDFPDNFDALNGLHSYLYTNSDMVVEALASQKYDLARDIVTAVETHDMASGKDALLADAPQRDAPAKDTQNIG